MKMLAEVLKSGDRVVLPPDPSAASLVPLGPAAGQPSVSVDVVFPVLHGTFGEDGTVQGLLELAGLPYVGAGVLASAVGMDKDVQKRLFEQAGLPIVPFLACAASEWEHERAKVLKAIKKKFRFPFFVKPATLGSSVGMTRVKAAHEISAAMDLAAEFGLKIIVERGVNGREIEVSVLGNDDLSASIPGEIVPHREFYDYPAKYLEQGTQLVIPAKLTKKQVAVFQDYAVRAFRAIDGSGHGALRFLSGTAQRQDFRERAEHHSGLYVHQHVSEAVGSFRTAVSEADRPADRAGARAASRKGPHQSIPSSLPAGFRRGAGRVVINFPFPAYQGDELMARRDALLCLTAAARGIKLTS